mgnify:CR=1 FL=1
MSPLSQNTLLFTASGDFALTDEQKMKLLKAVDDGKIALSELNNAVVAAKAKSQGLAMSAKPAFTDAPELQ